MHISDLIKKVGDENIEMQNVGQNMDSAQVAKGCGFITFKTAPDKVTDMLLGGDQRKWMGLVVWMPQARVDAAMKQPEPRSAVVVKDGSPTILTRSGRYFPLLNPLTKDVSTKDIAHGLSMVCRFAGHTEEFYSVAQHSVLVASLVPPQDRLAALLHDASEAYIGDITRPLKPHVGGYKEIEDRITRVILDRFGVAEIPESVKQADLIALAMERRDLMPSTDARPWPCLEGLEIPEAKIEPLPPKQAKAKFILALDECFDSAA